MSTLAAVSALADNELEYPEGRPFAAIIGTNPSHGARSPLLWNAAFAAHGIEAQMVPVDVAPERLPAVLHALDSNSCFVGGAIAVPYKEAVARWLGDGLVAEARKIGAVNCVFRGRDGRIAGTNTDGEAAVASFVRRFGSPAGMKVVLLGAGGAGKAVAVHFRSAIGAEGRLAICSRSRSGEVLAESIGCEWFPWDALARALADADAVVNCTSVGWGEQARSSPLGAAQLARLPARTKVFDIIYQPSPTVLLALASARGLATLDGSAMNLEQAVLAYRHAAREPRGSDATRAAMTEARRALG